MSQAFGYTSIFGYGIETTWGTSVAPSLYNEISEESLGLDQKRIWKPTLGSTSQKHSIRGKAKVSGAVKAPMIFQGMETLFKNLLGSVSSAQIGVTGVYRHTFTLASALPVGLSLTVNRDSAALGGGSKCFRYSGCQISKLQLSQAVENFLEGTWEFEGKAEEMVAIPTASYPTFYGIDYEQVSTLTIGGVAIPAKVAELTIENMLSTDRYKLGQQTRKGLDRGKIRQVSGKVDLEFSDLTLYTYFQSLADAGALSIIFTGITAAGSTPYRMEIACPHIFFSGKTPNIKDAGPIEISLPFTASADGGAENSELSIILDNLLTTVA